MVRKLKKEYDKAGLEINFEKTESLTTREGNIESLKVDKTITNKFKYLGFIWLRERRQRQL